MNKGTQIITTSNYSKKNLIKILGSDNSISSVYQSFNFLKTSSTNYKTPENYVLHIGSFERRKDLITLVKAFKFFLEKLLEVII